MSTKVKGEAIKESSIPLSALSTDVQKKLSTTPDWNAQKDEAGHIKNRTHFFEWYNKPEDENFNDLLLGLKDKTPISVTEDGIYKIVKYLANECSPMEEQGFEYFNPIWEASSFDILDGFVTILDILGGSAAPKISISRVYDEDNESIYVTIQWYIDSGTDDVNKIIDEICRNYYIVPYQNYEIYKLNDKYISSNIARTSNIPKDIIKTTPQTLSDGEKKQVRKNIGVKTDYERYLDAINIFESIDEYILFSTEQAYNTYIVAKLIFGYRNKDFIFHVPETTGEWLDFESYFGSRELAWSNLVPIIDGMNSEVIEYIPSDHNLYFTVREPEGELIYITVNFNDETILIET